MICSVGIKGLQKMLSDGQGDAEFLSMIHQPDVMSMTLDHADKIYSFLLIKFHGWYIVQI